MQAKEKNILIYGAGLILFAATLFFVFFGVQKNRGMNENISGNEPRKTITQNRESLLANTVRAICYSGFRSGQHPDRGMGAKNPNDEEVLEDLNIIRNKMGFSLIRLYDSGENSETVLRLIQLHNLDIKVMLGVWLRAELSAHETCEWLNEPISQTVLDENKVLNNAEILRAIALAKQYKSIVIAVSVGNEALVDWNDHMVNVDTIISYCNIVSNAISQPVTVADNYLWWATKGKKLASAIDFISVHVYPVWEGKDVNEGLSYSIENIQLVRDSIPDARIVITEAGWPTTASEFGDRANIANQKRYFEELMNWAQKMNITTFFFEAFDEDWKGDPNNPLGAEKHWGLYTKERNAKWDIK